MIRINLLPVRHSKKKEMGKQVLVLFAAVLILAAILNFFWYQSRQSEYDRNQDQITKMQKRIEELRALIGEVENINKREKELKSKLATLAELERGRGGPVKMLDALAEAIPERLWLSSFDESGGGVRIVGSAASNEDVAEFMRRLNTIVYTRSRGLGRVVEVRRQTKTSRVELLEGSVITELPQSDITPFFSNIELKGVKFQPSGDPTGQKPGLVNFELTLTGSYT